MKPLEERFQQRHKSHDILLEAEPGKLSIGALEAALGYRARRITKYVARPSETEGLEDVSITLTRLSPREVDEIREELARLEGVRKVGEPPI
ncbi:MAG: hypothetical protein WDM89_22020 [Rhizomicrobium sp.]